MLKIAGIFLAVSTGMGRVPRLQASELHYHVIVRCNNRAFLFETDDDFEIYLGFLQLVRKRHRFTLFNYELMHSHVHLFLQPSPTFSLSRTMHAINKGFSLHYNKRRDRKGHFWIDRYKNIPVATDEHALTLMRYINRNAVRAGIAQKPGDWKWSGYRCYAFGETNDLLELHPSYLALNSNAGVRQREFRKYVCQIVPGEDQRQNKMSDSSYIGGEEFRRKLGLCTRYTKTLTM